HGLVCHYLRALPQPVLLGGFNRHTKIGCIAQIRGHLTDHNRGVRRWQGVGLHDYRRSRLAVVAGGSPCDDVATLHLQSNSETASIHLMASSSRSRSSAATALATRRLTAFERGSGTTRRSSRKPRARRRSRIARILSAASATSVPSAVTRYSVTRYKYRHKLRSGRWLGQNLRAVSYLTGRRRQNED